jgi:hypothetical protein
MSKPTGPNLRSSANTTRIAVPTKCLINLSESRIGFLDRSWQDCPARGKALFRLSNLSGVNAAPKVGANKKAAFGAYFKPWRPNREIQSGPTQRLAESYREFEPPSGFKRNIETLLRYVPPEYLIGLKSIVLTNRAGLTRNKRKQKIWSRNRKVRLAEALGSYTHSTKSSPASVWLYVDNIVEAGSAWRYTVPVFRYVVTGKVLYHEIGHHISATHRPVHRENVADYWSHKLRRDFYSRHYRYISPVLYVLARLSLPIFRRLEKTDRFRPRKN